jgi:Protein of unknown function DUF262/Protein of unknown function (DUF1524)
MAEHRTEVVHLPFAELLRTRQFRVPIYQRSFSWTLEEVEELLQDLRAGMRRPEEEYFLGSIVFTPPPGRTSKDRLTVSVIDGQQRLAVLTMIFAAFRDYFFDKNDPRVAQIETDYLFTREFKSQSLLPRLTLNAADALFFEHHVLSRPKSAERLDAQVGKKSPNSHRRIADAYKVIRTDLGAWIESAKDPLDALDALRSFLETSAKVLTLEVATEANAYQIFETLNDRGLDLSVVDLLKNYLFGQASPHLERVQRDWHSATSVLDAVGGEKVVKTFIRHFSSSKYGLVRERELYESFKKRIRNSSEAVQFAADLGENAVLYSAILNQDHEFWNDLGTGARQNVGTLMQLRMEQHRPLLLAGMVVFNRSELKKLLQLIVSWSVRFRIIEQLGSSAIEQFYGNIGAKVRGGEIRTVVELARHAAEVVPSDRQFEQAFGIAKIPEGYLARYILRMLEREFELKRGVPENEVIRDEQQVNLEHIFPRKAKLADWPGFERDSVEFYTDRLGNLALLLAAENTRIGNKPFADKKKIFGRSSLALTKGVAARTSWNPSAIEKRQAMLAELAVTAWPLKAV